MGEFSDKALLPQGLSDVLPPEAAVEAETVERLMAAFARRGYERVKPPLLEFEESLLGGIGAAMTGETFRLMDPVSRRMMGLRADMTLQIARIATTRLAKMPRPLRLGYAGQVLRTRGTQLRTERQFGQVGAELIGSAAPGADAEVIVMATEALTGIGITGLSVDLCLPTLVPAISRDLGLDAETDQRLRTALDRKDAAAVTALAERMGEAGSGLFAALLDSSGPAERALSVLERLELSPEAGAERSPLARVFERVRTAAPDLTMTVDLVENRGFDYHTGVTFTFFARGVRGELGSGGRYRAGDGGVTREPATGLTLFMDTVLRALPRAASGRRLFIPLGTDAAAGRRLRDEGWATVEGLEAVDDDAAEAGRLGCSHVFTRGRVRALASVSDGED